MPEINTQMFKYIKIEVESHICGNTMLSVSGEICVNVCGFGRPEVGHITDANGQAPCLSA